MKKITILEKDLKLLLLLLSLLMIGGSYFLFYNTDRKKADIIKEENQKLETRLTTLKTMQANANTRKKETSDLNSKSKKIMDQFPEALQTEDAIVMISKLEQATGCTVSSMNFDMNKLFYPTNEAVASTAAGTSNTSGTASGDTSNSNTASTGMVSADTLTGYKSTVTFAYQSTYSGLKQIIDFINLNPDKMSINDITSAFDASTGNLIGSITVNMYSLSGTGKQYQEPEVNDVNIGLNNIFGTMEIQKKAK